MLLDDALEELRECILRDASSLKSGPPDSYWTDRALLRYLNDARSRFARNTLCIRDSTTPDVTQIELAVSTDTYPLDRVVIAVLSARHEDSNADMRRIAHSRALTDGNDNTEDWATSLIIPPGRPTRFLTNEGFDTDNDLAGMIRFFGTPDAGQDGKLVYLRVARKPRVVFTESDLGTDVDIEMPEDYALDVLEWAAYRALRNWDLDAQDIAKAERHKTRFEEACKECKRDIERKLANNVQWRFGGGGFTYTK